KRYGYLYCQGKRGNYLKDWIGKGKKVLDLGCRDGELTKYFVNGNEVIGADVDSAALNIAREKLGIKTLWLDLNTEFPFERESLDVIVACEIVEHIYYAEPFIKKIFEVLKHGGLFLGSVPNSFRVFNRIKFLFGKEFEPDPTHMKMFSYLQLENLLSNFFVDVQILPLTGRILPFLKVSEKTPHTLNRLFARDLLWKAVKK
ncbi:MAG: class I SAM-dependent methyltransferase, partial [Candidatus Aureabacteria bacterium]|nr:class I SAM-dependent methyltransferase [Candidatus Auribacterota bacterium]